jgi:enoyl-CoA hydratase/carnithine racemase
MTLSYKDIKDSKIGQPEGRTMASDDGARDDVPSDPVITSTPRPGILLVTLNRPAVGNALDEAMIDRLSAIWRDAAEDPTLRCLVVTGAGRFFCTGADVNMLSETTGRRAADTAAEELRFLPGPVVPFPVIAAVNGTCAGGGLHFVGDADIAIAAEGARFIDPHVTVGQVSALEPLELRLRMRPDRLARMVLLGRSEVLEGAAAEEAGLVSEIVPADRLLDRALELAERIAANSPEAVRLSRRVLRDLEADLIGRHADLGWELIRRHWAHPDAAEGPAAFLEKRAPRWSDR